MKEHFQDYGVRKWAGDDLIDLQKEALDALQGLVEPYAPCIIQGCAVVQDGPAYKIEAGLAALRGVGVDGRACVKVVRVEAFETPTLPVYLSLACDQLSRAYADGSSKAIANNYIAVRSVNASEGAFELTADGGKRLVDTIGITKKLDRVGGEAKDTVVGFVEAAARSELKTGSKLGVLIGQAKKWFSDLRALAFKDKVAKSDLDEALTTELDNKVAKVTGKGLSTNDFTQALLDKLNGIASGANKYTHPVHTAKSSGLYKITVDSSGHVSAVEAVTKADITNLNIPAQDTTYGAATTSAPGLMSAADKTKLNGIATGANNYTHPTTTGNKHIPAGGSSGQILGWNSDGTAKWSGFPGLRLYAHAEIWITQNKQDVRFVGPSDKVYVNVNREGVGRYKVTFMNTEQDMPSLAGSTHGKVVIVAPISTGIHVSYNVLTGQAIQLRITDHVGDPVDSGDVTIWVMV